MLGTFCETIEEEVRRVANLQSARTALSERPDLRVCTNLGCSRSRIYNDAIVSYCFFET